MIFGMMRLDDVEREHHAGCDDKPREHGDIMLDWLADFLLIYQCRWLGDHNLKDLMHRTNREHARRVNREVGGSMHAALTARNRG
jgi:hypothetical protein